MSKVKLSLVSSSEDNTLLRSLIGKGTRKNRMNVESLLVDIFKNPKVTVKTVEDVVYLLDLLKNGLIEFQWQVLLTKYDLGRPTEVQGTHSVGFVADRLGVSKEEIQFTLSKAYKASLRIISEEFKLVGISTEEPLQRVSKADVDTDLSLGLQEALGAYTLEDCASKPAEWSLELVGAGYFPELRSVLAHKKMHFNMEQGVDGLLVSPRVAFERSPKTGQFEVVLNGLSTRPALALRRLGYHYAEDLARLSKRQIRALHGFGFVGWCELEDLFRLTGHRVEGLSSKDSEGGFIV